MMERKYIYLATLLVIMALGLVILPKKSDLKEMPPKVLLSAIAEKSRYLSVDQVTHRIIENDPTLMLIDLRPADQFKTFALQGSVNLSIDSLLASSTVEQFNQPGKDKVLIANSDLVSEKAWLLCSRNAIPRVYIMKGGMNEWFTTFIQVKPVSGTPSSTDLDLLSFRKAAKQYFTGARETNSSSATPVAKENVPVVRKAPKATSGGGC